MVRRHVAAHGDTAVTVRVVHHRDAVGWWSTSPEIEGWFGTGDTYEEVHRFAEECLRWVLDPDVQISHEVADLAR